MPNPSKRKGDRLELEVQAILRDILGVPARRKLGAGRKDDMGDIDGVPDTTISVTGNRDVTVAYRVKPRECEVQQRRAGSTFGATFVRLHGGEYRVVLTPEQFATLWREAQPFTVDVGPGSRDLWTPLNPPFTPRTLDASSGEVK